MAKKEKVLIEAFEKGSVFTIEDAPVKWAMVHPEHPDTKWEARWKVDVVLNEKWKENLQKAGFNVYQDDSGDWVLRVIRKVKTRLGKTQSPPLVVDADGNKMEDIAIGNGSVCDIVIFAKYNTVASKTFLNAYLNKLVVKDLIVYEGGSSIDLEDVV